MSTETASTVVLDVRDELRRGGEPFDRIMAAVNQLQPGQQLELWAIFEPRPLFGVLAGMGFTHRAEPQSNGDWRVTFFKD
ncbi:MAG: DUF2249 domain-containing protein [Chloroflexota bacterium]|nr:DUF2249 domain-containing protein [Chloroflexota bacterium]